MQKRELDTLALVATLLASLWALTLLAGPYGAVAGLAGIALLLVLFSFDQDGYRSGWQSLAFGAVCGFCATDTAAYIARYFLQSAVPGGTDHFSHEGLAVFLAGATVIFWAIDRARMSARQPAATPFSFREMATPPRPAAPAISPVPQPQAAPPPVPAPASAEPGQPPMRTPEPVAAPAGKETSIYVALIGEGLNVMRSVRAQHLGRDFYKIVEEMPEGETWQYQPGQVVRARKKNLSSGKALVAIEEAPRAS